MPDLSQLLVFIAAGVVLNLTPGPDVMFIIANTVRSGLRAGTAASCGIAVGCLVHVAAAAAGVSALLAASGAAFAVLKWLGAFYLIYVGVQMLRCAWRSNTTENMADNACTSSAPVRLGTQNSSLSVFRRGFLTNVLNPKVALFFLAFVPQFIAPGTAHSGWIFLALGLVFTANGLLMCLGWALAAAWATRSAGVLQRCLRWLDGVAGGLFVAFGVKLALTEAPLAR